MSDDYLAEVEQREQAATRGPWRASLLDGVVYDDGSSSHRAAIYPGESPGPPPLLATMSIDRRDAEFIAAARTDVPRMVEALRRALAWADLQARPFPDGTPDREGEAVAAGLRDVITEALGGEQA